MQDIKHLITLKSGETFTYANEEEATCGRAILDHDDAWFGQYGETRASYIARYKDGGTFFVQSPAPEPETTNAIKADKVWQAKWEAAWPQHAAKAPEPVQGPGQVYKVVQTVNGKMVATLPTNIYAWATANGRRAYHVARVSHLRPELQRQPRIEGLCGPMWDGFNAEGVPVIRYEDQKSCDTLSA